MEQFKLKPFTLENSSLANKIILITGAGSGIGRTLALQSAKQGASVVLLSKNLKKLESLYDEIMAQGSPEPAIHPLNLLQAQPKHAAELAVSIKDMFGKLDAIVHNAGISGPITPIEYLPPEKWQEVVQLNLNIPYLLTHALLPLLKENHFASILFTTANEAIAGKAYWSAYSASKFGVWGLAQSLHQELESNTTIRVNCINPGKVRTAFRVNPYPGIDPEDFSLPEEIIQTYLYLLTDKAKEIRGKWIEV